MKISEVLQKGFFILKEKNIEFPKLKSRLLMEYLLDKNSQYIIVNDMKELNEEDEKKYFEYINKLVEGYPIEYITNKKEFMKMNFYVNENVLIPRQDTEILVEEVIEIAKRINAKKILDLCTGSGAIAISLAKYLPETDIYAIDISSEALEVAQKNANINNVKVNFINSDIFENLKEKEFDIIVSNPPYIKTEVCESLNKEVKKEPLIALDGGNDGLYFYKKIIEQCDKYLKKDGFLCFEIGYDQKDEVVNIINEKLNFKDTYSKKDLYNNDRIVVTKLRR